MDDTPSGVVLFGICFGVIATFVALLWLINYMKGWRPSHMSSTGAQPAAARPVADPLPATSTNDGQRIAKPDNAIDAELPGNVLPEEAREIIRYQAKVEALAALVAAGKTPQTEGIELVFNCRRSGRADSPYAKARAAVQAQIGPARPEFVGEQIERIRREVAEEASR